VEDKIQPKDTLRLCHHDVGYICCELSHSLIADLLPICCKNWIVPLAFAPANGLNLFIYRAHLARWKRETIMKKLSQFAVSVSAALVCAAVPASFKSSPANTTVFSLNTAEARVGRPLTATSVAGVSRRVQRREYRRTAAGVAVGAAVGAAAVGAAAASAPVPVGPAVAGPAPVVGPGYGYGPGPYPDAVIVNPVTGRWCRTEPTGYQFCWTP
jgi:hypothetical protein